MVDPTLTGTLEFIFVSILLLESVSSALHSILLAGSMENFEGPLGRFTTKPLPKKSGFSSRLGRAFLVNRF
jgi:hypothetical protein